VRPFDAFGFTGFELNARIGGLPLSEVDPIKIMMAFLFDRFAQAPAR
jgi:hypothetical protein